MVQQLDALVAGHFQRQVGSIAEHPHEHQACGLETTFGVVGARVCADQSRVGQQAQVEVVVTESLEPSRHFHALVPTFFDHEQRLCDGGSRTGFLSAHHLTDFVVFAFEANVAEVGVLGVETIFQRNRQSLRIFVLDKGRSILEAAFDRRERREEVSIQVGRERVRNVRVATRGGADDVDELGQAVAAGQQTHRRPSELRVGELVAVDGFALERLQVQIPQGHQTFPLQLQRRRLADGFDAVPVGQTEAW